MSRPHSRSPLHSRNYGVPGRLSDGFYGEQYHSSVHSDQWRNSENSTRMEGSTHRDNGPVHGEEEVDHWAKFIEAIGHAKRQRYPAQAEVQRYEEKQSQGDQPMPRRLPRERLSSPKGPRYGADPHQRIPSPVQYRNDRRDAYSDGSHSKSLASGHSLGNKHDWMEHGNHNEGHEDRYQRSSFSERSLRANYREPLPSPKRFRDLDPQEEHSRSYRGFSPKRAPVIVEHDHGIPKHHARNRDPPHSRDPLRIEHPRSQDPPRGSDYSRDNDHRRNIEAQEKRDTYRRNDLSRNREPPRNKQDLVHRGGLPHDRHGGPSNYHFREETRIRRSAERGSSVQDRSRPKEQPRLDSHSKERGHMTMVRNNRKDSGSDRSNKPRASGHVWEDNTELEQNHGVRPGQGHPHHRNTPAGGAEHETLRIKVDMSRPVGHSSLMGYSSERQLSLDLVNVGRQRLDFLPMLKHSGTYKETAVHTGTFAQEIITLVHQVKENYFRGQGISLNERFSSEQYYFLGDELSDGEQELEEIGQVINRPLGNPSSDTQIFCKIGSSQPQRRQVPDPSDLRYNLEMKRQQRLEGVKITIAGGNFSQMPPQGRGSSSDYVDGEDHHEGRDEGWSDGWSEQTPQQTEERGGPQKKINKANINTRWYFNRVNRRPGPRERRNPKNGAR